MSRYLFIVLFLLIFSLVSFVSRTSLALYSLDSIDMSLIAFLKIYLVGFFYDAVAVSYYIVPFIVYMIVIPKKMFNSKIHKFIALSIFFVVIFSVIFNAFSEWFFWEEFGKRFNFIAVDYLVYTQEVIGNIRESYPVPLIIAIVFFLTLFSFYIINKKTKFFERIFNDDGSFIGRLVVGVFFLSLPIVAFYGLDKQSIATSSSVNKFNQELSKSGLYSLFSAFRNNTLDYEVFYKTMDINIALKNLEKLIGNTTDKSFENGTTREVKNSGKENKPNIMLVMIESLSAEYMGAFGDTRKITPHLDNLVKKSLFFNNLYATGTRTVRGMEAVTLSLPPTPGRSVVKRPDNHDMFSSGFVTKDKGYENKFIYGGHGYFDNMNDFFSHNGFDIVDRTDFSESEITFANIWGVSDGDLYTRALKEADKSYSNKKPFFNFLMTTSNHRPYTYPDGKIDIPSHTGRDGAVKYTDFAINEFIETAKTKPWFDNTVFIFVADHNGGSAGNTDLPVWRYKIPLIIYAPKIIEPQIVSKLSSQIDLMPTLFSMLNWSYESKFFGNNILDKNFKERALIGTYQKLGLLRDDKLTILSPDESVKELKITEQTLYSTKYENIDVDVKDELDVITYFQAASYLYKHNLNRK